ncbi:NAD(P)/FAD-dependent oxidoreductase [Amycolatopsis pithecellobii]|uniref:FAD-dependent oxidoreductase n=1 Tax=Amycolatopsis pithecellobii TaxID=664692 RepID=A0A6N7Z873_9PSEU|nr:FAD-binding oxidoreductase [Amycolatopsis pithecellobii]MTD57600.1 FAD-dependent oxidoreductase [Amycolatopsis pithecellobii]
MRTVDVLVIGGGIAGVSAACELAAHREVCLVERESMLSAHSTGRSAATFVLALGAPGVRALTRASAATMTRPPDIFTSPLLSPRPTLWFCGAEDLAAGERFRAEVATPEVEVLTPAEAHRACPILRTENVALAMWDPTGSDVDVAALHAGYLRGLLARGGTVHRDWRVAALERDSTMWTVRAASGDVVRAPVVVNAAGAWSDEVAGLARVRPAGLTPLRRTVFLSPSDAFPPRREWPTLASLGGLFYLKPEGREFLCSPIDATPEAPGDPKPDEPRIAKAIEDINTWTRLGLRHVRRSWAGQRTYAADGLPVVGFDPVAEGFFWLSGQGGFGIQTAPAMAGLTRDLIVPGEVSPALAAAGVHAETYSPERLASGA